MNLLYRRIIAIGSALIIVATVLAIGGWRAGLFKSKPNSNAAWVVKPAHNAATPLDNNCSGGYVVLTFDGGPVTEAQGGGTPLVLATLQKLHLKAVFFVIGTAVIQNPEIVRQEIKDGDSVQNHTWDHGDFTGHSTKNGKPMSLAQVKSELQRGAAAIVKAGAPAPTLYRPPFDDVTTADDAVAKSLGERIVLSIGDPASHISDSQDWKQKFTGAQIAYNVIHGFNDEGEQVAGLQNGTIIGYHDGLAPAVSTPAAYSLQPIVTYMNAHHLCSTTTVPNPADGGIFSNSPW
jgi:peptidoglycan/xylan/chitin deacetylase (PgdA/CDA1 family)